MKSAPIKGVTSSKPKQMVRAELTTTRTTGIDTNHWTTLTLLLVLSTQFYMWTKVHTVRIAK